MSKQPYPIATLYGLRARIDPTPDYQRPPAWTMKQKQLLIDTILRGTTVANGQVACPACNLAKSNTHALAAVQ